MNMGFFQAQLFKEKNRTESESTSDGLMTCSSQHISAENIIQRGKRRSAADTETKLSSLSPSKFDIASKKSCHQEGS